VYFVCSYVRSGSVNGDAACGAKCQKRGWLGKTQDLHAIKIINILSNVTCTNYNYNYSNNVGSKKDNNHISGTQKTTCVCVCVSA